MDKNPDQNQDEQEWPCADAFADGISEGVKKLDKLSRPETKTVHEALKIIKNIEANSADPMLMFLVLFGSYADFHFERYGSLLADDGVLGQGMLQMLRGYRTLLNGDLQGLDGGTLDSWLLSLAEAMGFEEEI